MYKILFSFFFSANLFASSIYTDLLECYESISLGENIYRSSEDGNVFFFKDLGLNEEKTHRILLFVSRDNGGVVEFPLSAINENKIVVLDETKEHVFTTHFPHDRPHTFFYKTSSYQSEDTTVKVDRPKKEVNLPLKFISKSPAEIEVLLHLHHQVSLDNAENIVTIKEFEYFLNDKYFTELNYYTDSFTTQMKRSHSFLNSCYQLNDQSVKLIASYYSFGMENFLRKRGETF